MGLVEISETKNMLSSNMVAEAEFLEKNHEHGLSASLTMLSSGLTD